MTREHHRGDPASVSVAVVTVSDTRTPKTDRSGAAVSGLCRDAGHRVASERILPDDPDRVREWVRDLANRREVDAVILSGGTGLSRRDRTYEALETLIERRIEGFGELFRFLSFQEIGPAAILSRAMAGAVGETVVFSLPGSERAVRLAMERLILPQLAHVVGQLRKVE